MMRHRYFFFFFFFAHFLHGYLDCAIRALEDLLCVFVLPININTVVLCAMNFENSWIEADNSLLHESLFCRFFRIKVIQRRMSNLSRHGSSHS